MAGAEDPENPLLALGLGRSTSYSDNSKGSSPTACIVSPSSVKETDEESSMDLGFSFDLSLGHDKKSAGSDHVPPSGPPKLGLQLTLSTGSPESAVTNASTASINVPEAFGEIVMRNSDKYVAGKRSGPSNLFFGHSLASSSYGPEATYSFSLPVTHCFQVVRLIGLVGTECSTCTCDAIRGSGRPSVRLVVD
jgi:hypothetical protein